MATRIKDIDKQKNTIDTISLKTRFIEKEFKDLDEFIIFIFPDICKSIAAKLKSVKDEQMDILIYGELEDRFKDFLEERCGDQIERFLLKETLFVDLKKMKQIMISTMRITLVVKDENNKPVDENAYLKSIRSIIAAVLKGSPIA